MAAINKEAKLIINALGLMPKREDQEQWLTTYMTAREARVRASERQPRRVFAKTQPADLRSATGPD